MKYEITVTLKPTMYRHKPCEQFSQSASILRESFIDWECTIVAELTGEENVHYHVYVEFETGEELTRLLNRLRRYNNIFGRKHVSQVLFDSSYRQYLVKDIAKTTSVLHQSPVIRDFYGLTKDLFEYSDTEQVDYPFKIEEVILPL